METTRVHKWVKFNWMLVMLLLGCFSWSNTSIAGVFTEEFDSKQLDERQWVIKTEGKASSKIADGKLVLTSPAVADGIILFYQAPITKDITIEVRLDTSLIANDGSFGFTDEIIPPMLNTDNHQHSRAQIYFNADKWHALTDGVHQPPVPPIDVQGKAGWHVFKVEIKKTTISFFVDGEDIFETDKILEKRFLAITPDWYTSHYSGTLTVDWVKLSGEEVKAVEALNKLAAIWGNIKRDF
jgi:hypothetical protein